MAEKDQQQFVVRNIPGTGGLDGAFRIHLSQVCMTKFGLNLGDLCQITNDKDEVIGNGIAWRASEGMGSTPKIRPAKTTETLREAFEIEEGSRVGISKTEATIVHADRITLVECTSTESREKAEKVEGDRKVLHDRKWRHRCEMALDNAEAVALATTFEVAKKGVKKRYRVENITSTAAKPEVTYLYHTNDDTQVKISDGADSRPGTSENSPNVQIFQPLSTEGIGGLIEQLQDLNLEMRSVLEQPRDTVGVNHSTLIHGFEGTGKSLLLNRLATGPWRKVQHLRGSTLTAGTSTKNTAIITSIFKEAIAHQPSLILMDDLHDITDQTYVTAIAQGLDEICGLRVLCVATCRSLGDVNRKLFTEDRFLEQVELPIPDLKARALILSAMLMHAPDAIKGEIPMLSSRTHGCTGRDLARLRRYAERAAERRRMQPLGESHRFSMNGSTYLTCNVSEGLPNGQSDNDVPTTPTSALTIQDFVIALPKLHPSALGEHFSETPKTSWSDIGGSGAMKYRFEKALNWPLKHADILREFNFLPHKGVLLYGPPGCSKTLTAQAVAANYDMNFIAVKGAELVSMYVGESERAVREVFRKARTAKPCIIFFDEIDSIAGERDSGGTKGLNVLTTLLTEMDGFGTTETGVLVLAATNKPWILDPAIMRPGRFDEHIYLPPPDAAARREILNIQIGKLPSEHDLDFSLLVRELGGYTGAEIVSVCRQATQEPIERKVGGQRAFVGMADFERGLRMVKKAVTEVELRKYEAFASPK